MTLPPTCGVDGPAVVSPTLLGIAPDTPLPGGTVVELAGDTRRMADGLLLGGSPRRFLRLSRAGASALEEIEREPVATVAARVLGRRLTDAGLAVVSPPLGSGRKLSVTVVVPVRDRAALLTRCLASVGREVPVVVVDDGSRDHVSVAAACAARGASLVRRPVPGGPAAARNAGLAVVESDLVAFLDSDCVAPPGWVAALGAHFIDPLVAAVAPRVVGDRPGSVLDLGTRSGPVAPLTRIPYVPAAALVARRDALGDGFDAALRYGEDVDLIWRLVDAGWRVRYDATVVVRHAEPARVADRFRRRFRYGTSAAPLAARHPGKVRHLALPPMQALIVGAVMAGYPAVGTAAFCASAIRHVRSLGARGVPARVAMSLSTEVAMSTWMALGRCLQQFALVAAAAYTVGRGRRGWRGRPGWRRLVVAATVLAPLVEGRRAGSGGERGATRLVERLGEEAAYGAGVCAGWLGRGSQRSAKVSAAGTTTSRARHLAGAAGAR